MRAAAARLKAQAIDTSQLDAETLLADMLGLSRLDMLTDLASPISAVQKHAYDALIARRAASEPVAYITQIQEFWSLPIAVSPDVLIPRPDSETVIDALLAKLGPGRPLRGLDVGTGSGCLACALMAERPELAMDMLDVSAPALAMAQRNVDDLGFGARARLMQVDMASWQDVPAPYDFVISNPPYISTDGVRALGPNVRDFEPLGALDGGSDGLSFYRVIARRAKGWLAENGLLALEIGMDQSADVTALLRNSFSQIVTHQDLAGRDRAILAQRTS